MAVTTAEGKTFESAESAAVIKDLSENVTIKDDNGYQTDGTAKPTDTLSLTYGSTLGVPKNIVWYCNGGAKGVYTIDGGTVNDGFNNLDIKLNNAGKMPTGRWYVTIENTEGNIFISNDITVAEPGVAVIKSFSIVEDYETANAANLVFDSKGQNFLVDVVLNKDYPGDFYLIDASKTNYKTADMVGGDVEAEHNKVTDNIAPQDKASKITAKNAFGVAGAGISYSAEDGETHIIFQVSANDLTRGTSYKLIFDQEDVDTDNIKAGAAGGANGTTKTPNISEAFTCPYLAAPTAVTVKSYSSASKVLEVNLLGADGGVLSWFTTPDGGPNGFNSIKVFSGAQNKVQASDAVAEPDSNAIKEGVATLPSNTKLGQTFAYAIFKTEAGVFAEKSETLTTNVAEGGVKPMETMVLSEDKDDPTAAVVEFGGLRSTAAGKVYILQGTDNTDDTYDTAAKLAKRPVDEALGSAEVVGTAEKVVIPNVFKAGMINTDATTEATDHTDDFLAVFVPSNEALYTPFYSGAATTDAKKGDQDPTDAKVEFFNLKSKATSFELDGTVAGFKVSTSGNGKMDETAAVLVTYNQFDKKMDTAGIAIAGVVDADAPSDDEGVAMTFVGKGNTSEDQKMLFAVAADDAKISIQVTDSVAVNGVGALKGDKYTYKLNDKQILTMECTKDGIHNESEWKISVSAAS